MSRYKSFYFNECTFLRFLTLFPPTLSLLYFILQKPRNFSSLRLNRVAKLLLEHFMSRSLHTINVWEGELIDINSWKEFHKSQWWRDSPIVGFGDCRVISSWNGSWAKRCIFVSLPIHGQSTVCTVNPRFVLHTVDLPCDRGCTVCFRCQRS